MIWGVKCAPRDARAMLERATEALAELGLQHGGVFQETVLFGPDLSPRNLEATEDAFASADHTIVHVPFTTTAGHDVDIAHREATTREAAWDTWLQTIALADRLGAEWTVLHPGGLVADATPQDAIHGLRGDALAHLEAALIRLRDEHGAERVLLENMPTLGHFADHATPARFLLGQSVVDLAMWRDLVAGFTLDTSHAVMTPAGRGNLDALLGRVANDIRHVHVSDGRVPRGEGLQIGDGVVDWELTLRHLGDIEGVTGHNITMVPEIMGGHKDGGAGFVEAYRRLAARLISHRA